MHCIWCNMLQGVFGELQSNTWSIIVQSALYLVQCDILGGVPLHVFLTLRSAVQCTWCSWFSVLGGVWFSVLGVAGAVPCSSN